jgi:pimeloyl-ACP methyl ester carboxylesterase
MARRPPTKDDLSGHRRWPADGFGMAPLSDLGLRCVAYDRRGHGGSDDPGRGFDYDTLADDLAAVLAARGLRGVTLVAHSMAGGEVVRYLSRLGSERVRGLVLRALRDMMRTSLRAILDCNRAMLETDFAAELDAIDVPALLIHGDADASIPLEASSALAVDLIPSARLSVYENAPHGLMLSHRERFNEDLVAFAKGEPGQR